MEIAFCIHVYHRARSNCWKEDVLFLTATYFTELLWGGAKIYTCSIKRRWKDWKGALVEDQDKYSKIKFQWNIFQGFFSNII